MDVDGRRPVGSQIDPSLNTSWLLCSRLDASLQPLAVNGLHTRAMGYNSMSGFALGSLCGSDYGGPRLTIKSRFDGDMVLCDAFTGRPLILELSFHLGPGSGIWKVMLWFLLNILFGHSSLYHGMEELANHNYDDTETNTCHHTKCDLAIS